MAEAYTPHNVHHDGRPHKQAVKLSWETYFRTGIFSDWQRLMYDLGFTKPFYSKTQCRKVGLLLNLCRIFVANHHLCPRFRP